MRDAAGLTETADSHQRRTFERNVVQAVRGVGIYFAGRMLGYGARFGLGILLARMLGADQLGLYNLALSAAAIAGTLALLGLDTGLVRYVAAFASRRDEARLWGALQVGIGIPALLGMLLGLGLAATAGPIADQLFHEPRLVPLLRLVGLVVPFLALGHVVGAATRGFKNQHYTVIAKHISQPVVKVVALLGLALVGLTAEGALTAYILAEASGSILLLYFLHRQFHLVRSLREAQRNIREMLSFSVAVYLSNAIKAVTRNIQTLVLATSSTVAVVGIFAVASQTSMLGKLLYSSIVTVSMPFISELNDRNDKKGLGRFYRLTTRWTFTLNLPLFLVVVLFPQTLLSVFGESFEDGAQALTILAWATLVKTASGTNSAILDMTGYTKLKLANSIITAATTVGLNVLLIPPLGLMGAAIAALVGGIIVESLRLVEVFILLHLQPYDAAFLKPIAAGLVALAASLASQDLLAGQASYIRVTVSLAALIFTYAGVILALRLSPEDRMLLGRLRRRIRVG